MAFHSVMPGTSLDVNGLFVELLAAEVHQRVAEQLDLDAVGVLEVHRLLDPEVGARVLHTCGVQLVPDLLPAVPWGGDGDVLDAADRLDAGLQAETGEVEEAEQGLVAEVEEQVRGAGVVP